MDYQKAQSSYLANQILSASPNRLIEILLENAIKQTKIAGIMLEKQQLAETHKHLIKAQDIVTELDYSLNHEEGGEIADNLAQLYRFVYQRLVDANVSKEATGIQEAQKILEELLDTWQTVTADS